MNIVPDYIAPIRLLSGHHGDIGATGRGCFMDVIAYLNGESQITDHSPCVRITVRPMAIKLNDFGNDEQRQRLLPFVMRAMGSATMNKEVLNRDRARLRQHGTECQEIINAWRTELKNADADADADAIAIAISISISISISIAIADAYAYAIPDADADAIADAIADAYADADAIADASADAYADADAYAYADPYAYAKKKAMEFIGPKCDELKAKLFDAGLRYLDDVLPQADAPTSAIMERAATLCSLAAA